jgi:hypothetical protein
MDHRLSSVSNLSARLPRDAMRSRTSPWPSVPTSWGDAVRGMVRESNVWGPHSLHTAEVTGSIPVTPTSQNASRSRLVGPFARRFARRHRLDVVDPWSAWRDRTRWRAGQRLGRGAAAAGVQLASLEDLIALVQIRWGDRFRDLEGERQACVERLDDSGGHLWGGVPVAGADAAATL